MKDVEPAKEVSLVDFFANSPPLSTGVLSHPDVAVYGNSGFLINFPDVALHCSQSTCSRIQYFSCVGDSKVSNNTDYLQAFKTYRCRNCRNSIKIYALSFVRDELKIHITKVGEWPRFSSPIPSKLISMIGPDRELFIKGHHCEDGGFGIAAYVYYRRVIENQKNRIFDSIIKIAQQSDNYKDLINDLESAKSETQFSKAIQLIKHGLPESVLINGHNPLSLLHDVLSDGIHQYDDEACLNLAHDVRVILVNLATNVAQALRDDTTLKQSLSRIMARKSAKKNPDKR